MNKELIYWGPKNTPEIHQDIKKAARNNYLKYTNIPQEHLERYYLNNIANYLKNSNNTGNTLPINPTSTVLKNVVRPFHLSPKNLLWSNILRYFSYPYKNIQAQEINIFFNVLLGGLAYSFNSLPYYIMAQTTISSIDMISEMVGINLGLIDESAGELISNDKPDNQ